MLIIEVMDSDLDGFNKFSPFEEKHQDNQSLERMLKDLSVAIYDYYKNVIINNELKPENFRTHTSKCSA